VPEIELNSTASGSWKSSLTYLSSTTKKWSVGVDSEGNGTNNFFFYDEASGATRLFINSSGNVGIGTTSPNVLLDCQGTGSQTIRARTNDTSGVTVGSLRAEYLGGGGGANTNVELRAGNAYTYLVNTTNHPLLFGTNSLERARIDSSGRLLVGTSTARANFFSSLIPVGIQSEAGTQSLFQNSNDGVGPAFYLGKSRGTTANSNTVVQVNDQLGALVFFGADGTNVWPGAQITAAVDATPGANDMPGRLVFSVTADGASSPTEAMRITNGGNVLISTTSAEPAADNIASAIALREDGRGVFRGPDDFPSLDVARGGTDGSVVRLYKGTSIVGTISVTASATAYNTSSDYRLKENVVPLTGAIDRLQQIPVHRFNFIADPDTVVDGFIAHEAQEVVPECVTGTKDEVDEDGNPVYQGIDQSKIVPLLTAALQEALQKIEDLEDRLTAAGL
jgi:hypothetical protein